MKACLLFFMAPLQLLQLFLSYDCKSQWVGGFFTFVVKGRGLVFRDFNGHVGVRDTANAGNFAVAGRIYTEQLHDCRGGKISISARDGFCVKLKQNERK